VEVRQTYTQVLREEKTYQNFEESEMQRVKLMEVMGRDDSEFTQWKAEME